MTTERIDQGEWAHSRGTAYFGCPRCAAAMAYSTLGTLTADGLGIYAARCWVCAHTFAPLLMGWGPRVVPAPFWSGAESAYGPPEGFFAPRSLCQADGSGE